MDTKKILSAFQKLLLVLIGNTIYASAIVMFLLPNDLMTGGTTGLALFFQHQFQIPISLFVGAFNIIMFLLGAFVLGKTFAMTTLVSTFYYPICLELLQKLPFLSHMTDDILLSVLFSGLMIGVGIGIVIRAGASTGGMDIPPLILNKKLGLSVSFTLYLFDFCILLLQMTFTDKERILYGILLVIVYTVVLNKVLLMGKSQMQVKIVSSRYRKSARLSPVSWTAAVRFWKLKLDISTSPVWLCLLSYPPRADAPESPGAGSGPQSIYDHQSGK